MSNQSKLLITAVLLTLIAVVAVFYTHHNTAAKEPKPLSSNEDFARADEAMGLMSRPESLKWRQIMGAIARRKTITEPELSWLLLELPQPAPSPDATLGATRRLELMMALAQAKIYLPSQKEHIYSAVRRYLSGPEANDKIGALSVVRHLKETRAVPAIMPLLSDPNPLVRRNAKQTLKAIAE